MKVIQGQTTSSFALLKKQHLSSQSLSIIYLDTDDGGGGGEKALDLIIMKENDFDCIYKSITTIMQNKKLAVMIENREKLYINHLWQTFTNRYTNSFHLLSEQNDLFLLLTMKRSSSTLPSHDRDRDHSPAHDLDAKCHDMPMIISGKRSMFSPQLSQLQPPSRPASQVTTNKTRGNLLSQMSILASKKSTTTHHPAHVEIKESSLIQLLNYINYKRPHKTTHALVVKHLCHHFDEFSSRSLDQHSFTSAVKFLREEREEMKLLWNEVMNVLAAAAVVTELHDELLSSSTMAGNPLNNNNSSSSARNNNNNNSASRANDNDMFSNQNSYSYATPRTALNWSTITTYLRRTYTPHELKQLHGVPNFLVNNSDENSNKDHLDVRQTQPRLSIISHRSSNANASVGASLKVSSHSSCDSSAHELINLSTGTISLVQLQSFWYVTIV